MTPQESPLSTDQTHNTDGQAPCLQAWHGGLPSGLLIECKYAARHRGAHRNSANSLMWTGKLTADELAVAEHIRSTGVELAS